MSKKLLSLLPLIAIFVAGAGYLLYRHVTQPFRTRTETAKLICETDILATLKDATSVLSFAQNHSQGRSLNELVAETHELKKRLSEITDMVKARASGSSAEALALRDIASFDQKEHDAFAQSSADLAMRRCPDRANSRAEVLKAMEAITSVIKSMPK